MDSLKYCRIVRSVAIILLFLIVLDEFYVYVYELWDVFDQVLEYYEPKDYFTTFSSMFITAYALLYLAIRRPNDMSKILTICVMVIAYDSIIDAYFMLVEYRDIVDEVEVMIKMTLFLMGDPGHRGGRHRGRQGRRGGVHARRGRRADRHAVSGRRGMQHPPRV